MLISAFIALLFASAGDLPGQGFIDAINTFVKQSIIEPDRKRAISTDVSEIKETLKDFSKSLKSGAKRMVKLNKDHRSSREAFERILGDLNRERSDTQKKILELRFSLKDRLSRQEWQKAFGRR